MNKMIQSYIDGRMDAAERAEFEIQLATNPALKAEVDAYTHLKDSVRMVGQSETVPNLQPMLAAICRSKQPIWRTKGMGWSLAGIACFAIVFSVTRSPVVNPTVSVRYASAATIDLVKSPLQNHWHESNPQKAAELVRNSMHCPTPVISLEGIGASLKSAECGSCWMAFDIEYQDEIYTLYGRKESGGLDAGKPEAYGNKTLYWMKGAIGWYCEGGMTYVLKGGTPEGRQAIAKQACKETPKLF